MLYISSVGPKGHYKIQKTSFRSKRAHSFFLGWPHFRGVGELGNSSVLLLFIDHWTEMAQGRMATLPIVEHFDVLKNRELHLLTCLIDVPVCKSFLPMALPTNCATRFDLVAQFVGVI